MNRRIKGAGDSRKVSCVMESAPSRLMETRRTPESNDHAGHIFS